jgi:hypothetical protein
MPKLPYDWPNRTIPVQSLPDCLADNCNRQSPDGGAAWLFPMKFLLLASRFKKPPLKKNVDHRLDTAFC